MFYNVVLMSAVWQCKLSISMHISPNGEHWNQIDYILCSQSWRNSTQSAKTRPGAHYGSYYELLMAKFRLKFKKVGKTTAPFRYDLKQIPYNYTVEGKIDSGDYIW